MQDFPFISDWPLGSLALKQFVLDDIHTSSPAASVKSRRRTCNNFTFFKKTQAANYGLSKIKPDLSQLQKNCFSFFYLIHIYFSTHRWPISQKLNSFQQKNTQENFCYKSIFVRRTLKNRLKGWHMIYLSCSLSSDAEDEINCISSPYICLYRVELPCFLLYTKNIRYSIMKFFYTNNLSSSNENQTLHFEIFFKTLLIINRSPKS